MEKSLTRRPVGPIGLSLVLSLAIELTACGGGNSGSGGSSSSPPSGLSYPSPPAFTVNKAITPIIPLVAGTITNYTVSPALPQGLAIDSSTGIVSGTPTKITPSAVYTVTASNSSGSTSGGIPITVNDVAPTIAYTSSPYSFTQGIAVQRVSPTVTAGGAVTSGWSITPVLPPGLTWDSSTGAISGTPTSLSAATTYTVSSANSGGQATTTLSIAVNAATPLLAYPSPSYTFSANVPSQPVSPVNSGGAATGWSITPALPTGLALDPRTGNISGTPTAVTPPAQYVVTATNTGGAAIVTLTIGVSSGPLLNLGHSEPVALIRATNASVVSLDVFGHWTLQDYASGTELARGDGACGVNYCETYSTNSAQPVYLPVDIAGGTVIDAASNGVEVRSATSGAVLSTLPASYSWYRLAVDGSYISAGSSTALVAWDTSGHTLLTRSGDYSRANVFATPGQILVALGPAGQNVIETVSTGTGTSSTSSAFLGQFSAWFLDGGRFLTTQGNVVFTYSSSTVQQEDITSVSSTSGLMGQGDWFWTFLLNGGAPLNIYKVGASTSPALSTGGDLVIPSHNTLGVLQNGAGQLVTIDLSGASPVSSSTILIPINYPSAYAAIPGGSWVTGNRYGAILDGATAGAPQQRYLALGSAWSIAGGTSYFSVATASGKIFNYNSNTNALVGTLDIPGSQLAAASDGTILAAAADNVDAQYANNTNINVYSLPGANVTNNYNYVLGPNPVLSVSGDGSTLVGPISNTSGCELEAINLTGNGVVWCSQGNSRGVALSPDGTLIAQSGPGGGGTQLSASIYKNGSLVTAIAANPLTWLDNGRLLARTTTLTIIPPNMQIYNYSGAAIYDPMGNVLSPAGNIPLPDIYDYSRASSTSVYSAILGGVYSLTTGKPTWLSADAPTIAAAGGVMGAEVVFASGAFVLAQPYQ